jgi:hypothetical protein
MAQAQQLAYFGVCERNTHAWLIFALVHSSFAIVERRFQVHVRLHLIQLSTSTGFIHDGAKGCVTVH